MVERQKTLTVKMTEQELLRAHALATAGDESIGRWIRRVVNRRYEETFGDAPPPSVELRPGPGKKRARKGGGR